MKRAAPKEIAGSSSKLEPKLAEAALARGKSIVCFFGETSEPLQYAKNKASQGFEKTLIRRL